MVLSGIWESVTITSDACVRKRPKRYAMWVPSGMPSRRAFSTMLWPSGVSRIHTREVSSPTPSGHGAGMMTMPPGRTTGRGPRIAGHGDHDVGWACHRHLEAPAREGHARRIDGGGAPREGADQALVRVHDEGHHEVPPHALPGPVDEAPGDTA